MKPKRYTVAIDGNNLLAMNAHAHAELTNKDGFPTGGIYGVLRRINSYLLTDFASLDIDRVFYVADAGRPKFRRKLVPTYKTKRDEKRAAEAAAAGPDAAPDPFVQQMRVIEDVLHAVGVWIIKSPGFEADDCIGGMCYDEPRISKGHTGVIVVSGDKDLLQLASKKRGVKVFRPSDHSLVEKIPRNFLLRRALEGDSSDNIPGVLGIGPGKADKILADAPAATTPTALLESYKGQYAPKLQAQQGELIAAWKVMNLRRTAAAATAKMVVRRPGNVDAGAFKKYCKEYEFASILRELSMFLAPFNLLNKVAK